MRTNSMRWPLVAALLLIEHPTLAHHSYALFDLDQVLMLEGTVTKLDWGNPHVYIELDTGGPGAPELWVIQAEPPAVMSLLGWSRQSLAPGERVTVETRAPRRPGRRMALGSEVRKEDGTRLTMRPSPRPEPGPAVAAEGLQGQWLPEADEALYSAFLEPLAALDVTAAGKAAVEAYTDADNPSQDCVSEPTPYVMTWSTPKRIEVTPERVTILDSLGVERTVHMTVDSHDDTAPSAQGHSIGRWEDGELVVDTTRFAEHRRGNAWGLPSGLRKHLTERFALSADRQSLTYTFTVEDPDYLAEEFSGTLRLTYRPDLPFVTEPCAAELARRYLD